MSNNTNTDRLKRSIDWGIAFMLLIASCGFAILATYLRGQPAGELANVFGLAFVALALFQWPQFNDGLKALSRTVSRWRDRREVAP